MKITRVRWYMAEMTQFQPYSSLHDLLRYDIGFVKGVDDQPEQMHAEDRKEIIVAFPVFATRNGALGTGPTIARWRSHSVPIREATDHELQTLASSDAGFAANNGRWVTYRQPRNADGAQEYGSGLVSVSLEVFTNPKRRDTLDL